MATASARLNTPIGTNTNALTTESDAAARGNTAMVAGGAPMRSITSSALTDPMGMIRDLVRQPTVRKVLPIVVIMMVVAAFGLASMSMKTPPMRALTMMLPEADKQLAIETLKTANFKPEIDNNTGQIMVPSDKYQEARMLLASKGLPRTEVQGMDTLKDMPAMTTSQFMEQVATTTPWSKNWPKPFRKLLAFAVPECIWPHPSKVCLCATVCPPKHR
jgi:flagellar M-ring protein FliF